MPTTADALRAELVAGAHAAVPPADCAAFLDEVAAESDLAVLQELVALMRVTHATGVAEDALQRMRTA